MPKRIRYIVLITILVLLGFFVSKKLTAPSVPKQTQNSSSSSHQQSNDQASAAPAVANQEKVKKEDKPEQLTPFLSDPAVKTEDKVYRVRDLDLNPTLSIGKANIRELVTFINSENPLAHDKDAQVPHSAKAYQFQQEASLRVYSLKRLSQSLPLPELQTQIQNIIKGSSDPTIVKIAKQVLAAKEQGKDYFENMKQGLRSMGGPNHQHGPDTSHSRH